jgi:chromosome segregation ATPase
MAVGPPPASTIATVTRSLLERRLSEVADRLRELRHELVVTDEQLSHLAEQADEARLRALVSETPIAEQEHRQAQRHAEAMGRHRGDVQAEIERLERTQDDLLDRLSAELSR